MSDKNSEQVEKWLKKLERESWQLELLVSAFTIFLLIGARENYAAFLEDLSYKFAFNNSILALFIFFLSLIKSALLILTVFLVIHLLLRGFWIGTIGLRSVQPKIDYSHLRYSDFFLQKLKSKVIGLDRMVIVLDELCSVIFSLSFLIIFMLISFGLYSVFLGAVGLLFSWIISLTSGSLAVVVTAILVVLVILLLVGGVIYLIDYFSLGFFKKLKWFGRIYYPMYQFFGVITLSFVSRSIYYNLISKYKKSRIRTIYLVIGLVLFSGWFINYDQYQFYPSVGSDLDMDSNFYADERPQDDYVKEVSIESKYVSGAFFSIFLRYNPNENQQIRNNCLDFEPMKNDGFNSRFKIVTGGGNLLLQQQKYEEEDKERLLECLSDFYEISVNDSIYWDQKFYFKEHAAREQKGLFTVLPTDKFVEGANTLVIRKKYQAPDSTGQVEADVVSLPFWFSRED